MANQRINSTKPIFIKKNSNTPHCTEVKNQDATNACTGKKPVSCIKPHGNDHSMHYISTPYPRGINTMKPTCAPFPILHNSQRKYPANI